MERAAGGIPLDGMGGVAHSRRTTVASTARWSGNWNVEQLQVNMRTITQIADSVERIGFPPLAMSRWTASKLRIRKRG